MAEKKAVATKAKGVPFQAAKPYELPPLTAEVVDGDQLNRIRINSRYVNAAPVSETALSISKQMLADLGSGARIPLPKEHQEKEAKAKIKAELQKDLLRILTRQGNKTLSVRCADEGSALVFWFEPKRVQTPKANKGETK